MKELGASTKLFLVFIVTFAVTYYFLALPQVRAAGQVLGKLEQMRNQHLVAFTPSAQQAQLKERAEVVKSQALSLLPKTDEQYDLSVQVEWLAKEVTVTLSSLSVNASNSGILQPTSPAKGEAVAVPAAEGSAQKVQIGIGVGGSYENVQRFVRGLTTLGRYVQVEQLVVNVNEGQLAAQISAAAFYLPSK
jgi:Tfp pilus assembly protein PilO